MSFDQKLQSSFTPKKEKDFRLQRRKLEALGSRKSDQMTLAELRIANRVIGEVLETLESSNEKENSWTHEKFINWAIEELDMDEAEAKEWVTHYIKKKQIIDDSDKKIVEEYWIFDGLLDLSGKPNLKTFPPFKIVESSLFLQFSGNASLPRGLQVMGRLIMHNSQVTQLPNDLFVKSDFDAAGSALEKIGRNSKFGTLIKFSKLGSTRVFNVSNTKLYNIPESTKIRTEKIYISHDQEQSGLRDKLEFLISQGNIKGEIFVI